MNEPEHIETGKVRCPECGAIEGEEGTDIIDLPDEDGEFRKCMSCFYEGPLEGFTTVRFTLKTLMQNAKKIQPKIEEAAKEVGFVEAIEMSNIPTDPHFYDRVFKTTLGKYTICIRIKHLSTDMPALSTEGVQLACDCPSYHFTCSYPNEVNGLHEPINEVYQPKPVEEQKKPSRNPDNLPMMCKHLYSMVTELLEQGRLVE